MIEIDFDEAPKNSLIPFNKFISPNNLSNEDYHNLEAISARGLKQAWKDPKLYAKRSLLKRLPSPALDMGTAVHEALLEPNNFSYSNYNFWKGKRIFIY